MKITAKQKAYGVLLTVGAIAFCVDRGMGGPASADASPATAEMAGATAGPEAQGAVQPVSLIAGLQSLGRGDFDPQSVRDAFAPQKCWMAARLVVAAPSQGQMTASQFEREHKLSAVVLSAHNEMVMINDQIVRPGQMIDGFKLVAIGPYRATLLGAGARVELHMDDAPVNHSASY